MATDTTELRKLEEDLLKAIPYAEDAAWDEVKHAAQRTKVDWQKNLRQRMSTPSRIPHIPPAVSYDVTLITSAQAHAEIGYDRDKGGKTGRQAKIGHILEFGSVNNPPGNDGGKAITTEEPRFVAAMEDIADIPL